MVDGVLAKALQPEARSVRFRNHLGTLVQATMAPAPLRFAALVRPPACPALTQESGAMYQSF